MQIPSARQSSHQLVRLGTFHVAALGYHVETAALATEFAPINDLLKEKYQLRELLELELLGIRVALRFAEYDVERTIRAIAGAVHALDNNLRGGPTYKLVFPNTLVAELVPRAASQVTHSRALLLRINTLTAAEPLRAQFAELLATGVDKLEQHVAKRKEKALAIATVRAEEEALQEDWVTAYAKNAGLIRAMFPRQSDRQDLYFDDFRKSGSANNGDEDEELINLVSDTTSNS